MENRKRLETWVGKYLNLSSIKLYCECKQIGKVHAVRELRLRWRGHLERMQKENTGLRVVRRASVMRWADLFENYPKKIILIFAKRSQVIEHIELLNCKDTLRHENVDINFQLFSKLKIIDNICLKTEIENSGLLKFSNWFKFACCILIFKQNVSVIKLSKRVICERRSHKRLNI